MSRQLKEAARIRTSTWRGPGLGVGRSVDTQALKAGRRDDLDAFHRCSPFGRFSA